MGIAQRFFGAAVDPSMGIAQRFFGALVSADADSTAFAWQVPCNV